MRNKILIIFGFVLSLLVWNQMPDLMASHWDINGDVDRYMNKSTVLLLMPFISLFIYLLFLNLYKIFPLKEKIEKFKDSYNKFITVIIAFFVYIHALSIVYNMGYEFNMGIMIIPAIAIIFYFSGDIMEKSERNWIIGIRNAWTLSNDMVWEKTNKMGGRLFKLSAIVILLSILVPEYMAYILLIMIFGIVFYLTYYSYAEYKKISR